MTEWTKDELAKIAAAGVREICDTCKTARVPTRVTLPQPWPDVVKVVKVEEKGQWV